MHYKLCNTFFNSFLIAITILLYFCYIINIGDTDIQTNLQTFTLLTVNKAKLFPWFLTTNTLQQQESVELSQPTARGGHNPPTETSPRRDMVVSA